jgi:NADH-quinone oxidoreductase subunit A
MEAYLPILLFLLVALGFPLITLALAWVVRPSRYERVKLAAYECGMESAGEPRARYSVRFYVIAVLFVIFDVETIFLFPWAVRYRALGLFGLVEMGIFLGILILGYAYAWRKRALEWA